MRANLARKQHALARADRVIAVSSTIAQRPRGAVRRARSAPPAHDSEPGGCRGHSRHGRRRTAPSRPRAVRPLHGQARAQQGDAGICWPPSSGPSLRLAAGRRRRRARSPDDRALGARVRPRRDADRLAASRRGARLAGGCVRARLPVARARVAEPRAARSQRARRAHRRDGHRRHARHHPARPDRTAVERRRTAWATTSRGWWPIGRSRAASATRARAHVEATFAADRVVAARRSRLPRGRRRTCLTACASSSSRGRSRRSTGTAAWSVTSRDLARHLARRSVDVTLITRTPSEPMTSEEAAAAIVDDGPLAVRFVPYVTFPGAGRRGTTVLDRSTAYPLFGLARRTACPAPGGARPGGHRPRTRRQRAGLRARRPVGQGEGAAGAEPARPRGVRRNGRALRRQLAEGDRLRAAPLGRPRVRRARVCRHRHRPLDRALGAPLPRSRRRRAW